MAYVGLTLSTPNPNPYPNPHLNPNPNPIPSPNPNPSPALALTRHGWLHAALSKLETEKVVPVRVVREAVLQRPVK